MLHTVGACNNRDHMSIMACSPYLYKSVVLRAHPVRGEWHIQRNANGEIATVSNMLVLKRKFGQG